MSGYVTLSPVLLDQSFPRDKTELQRVAVALGHVQSLVEVPGSRLLLTGTLREFVGMTDWNQPLAVQPMLREIHRLLSQWFLQPHEGLVLIDVSNVPTGPPHPVPISATDGPLIGEWAAELGRVLKCHDEVSVGDGFFIGIACDRAFAGEAVGAYAPPLRRAFPLLAPSDVRLLDEADAWEVPRSFDGRLVRFDDMMANFGVIGASRVDRPRGSSHYKVHFPGKRPWPLDRNHASIPPRFLRQLETRTGYPVSVIKYALLEGRLPSRRPLLGSRVSAPEPVRSASRGRFTPGDNDRAPRV